MYIYIYIIYTYTYANLWSSLGGPFQLICSPHLYYTYIGDPNRFCKSPPQAFMIPRASGPGPWWGPPVGPSGALGRPGP